MKATGARPVVMQTYRALRATTNPYLAQLAQAVSPAVAVVPFGWRRAILGHYDVLHAHWPETLLLAGRPGLRSLARRALFLTLLLRLSVTRVAVVRTLHNVGRHERSSAIDRWLLERFDSRTTLWIRLTDRTQPPRPGPAVTIAHGHYRDWFADATPSSHRGRILTFGLIRPYKGVENLIARFAELQEPSLGLRVVGNPVSPALRARVESLVAVDPRVSATLSYVDDARLAAEIGEAELVVLPYRDMHNSGALLLALSLDRPVLVPHNAVTTDLAAEVGERWIATFEGELSADDLADALDRLRHHNGVHNDGRRPRLETRDWAAVGAAHVAAYRAAIRSKSRSSSDPGRIP